MQNEPQAPLATSPAAHYLPAQNMLEADYNPRQLTMRQAHHLLESLLLFGFIDPVIINHHPSRGHVMVGGHQRRRLAMRVFTEGVPAGDYVDTEGNQRTYPEAHPLAGQAMVHPAGYVLPGCQLTDPEGLLMLPTTPVWLELAREKELNLRLNLNTGEWDKDVLANQYQPLELLAIGFTENQLGLPMYEAPATSSGLGADDGPANPSTTPPSFGKPRLVISFATPEDAQEAQAAVEEAILALGIDTYTVEVLGMGNDTPEDAQ